MAGITGQGTTYNLPQYTGALFAITPEDTPLLSAIGGLTGGKEAPSAVEWEWSFYDLRNAGQNTRVEGANAPTAEERVRSNASNVLQIHQETVEVSYTRQAATGALAGVNNAAATANVLNELEWQERQMLKQIARDVEYSFIQGEYQKPADNTTARQTRGLLEAITTNVIDNGAVARDLTAALVLDAMQDAYDNGGLSEAETRTLITGSTHKRNLTKLFVTDKGYEESSRNVAGVNVSTIETDFGRVNIMLNRYMPNDTLVIASLEDLMPVFLNVPGKGHFFQEPLAKVGASERTMFYGEIGLEYGNERKHAKIVDLNTAVLA